MPRKIVYCSRPKTKRVYLWSELWQKQLTHVVEGCNSATAQDPGPGEYRLCPSCRNHLLLNSVDTLRAAYPTPPQEPEARFGSTLGIDIAYTEYSKPTSVPI